MPMRSQLPTIRTVWVPQPNFIPFGYDIGGIFGNVMQHVRFDNSTIVVAVAVVLSNIELDLMPCASSLHSGIELNTCMFDIHTHTIAWRSEHKFLRGKFGTASETCTNHIRTICSSVLPMHRCTYTNRPMNNNNRWKMVNNNWLTHTHTGASHWTHSL